MDHLTKIQKGIKVLQILSKIILVFACVGIILTSIAATLVASDMLNMENQFLHFLSVTAIMNKEQIVGTLAATACSLLSGAILAAFFYRYFTIELQEGTPFTNTGANKISQLGVMEIILSILTNCILDIIYESVELINQTRYDSTSNITFGIFLILLAVIMRYGAELEQKTKG